MSGKPWTDEQLEFIKQYGKDLTAEELKCIFNEHFNDNRTTSAVMQKRYHLGVNCGTSNHKYTKQETNWLKNNYGTKPIVKLHKEFCKKFNTDIGYFALKTKMQKLGLKLDDRNKWATERALEMNKVPIGTEREYGGYICVKVNDKVGKHGKHLNRDNWQLKQRYMWEKYHGEKVPENCQICFLDGNKKNFNKDNLICIPLKYMSIMTRNDWIEGFPEITKMGVAYCKLYFALKEAKGGLNGE